MAKLISSWALAFLIFSLHILTTSLYSLQVDHPFIQHNSAKRHKIITLKVNCFLLFYPFIHSNLFWKTLFLIKSYFHISPFNSSPAFSLESESSLVTSYYFSRFVLCHTHCSLSNMKEKADSRLKKVNLQCPTFCPHPGTKK